MSSPPVFPEPTVQRDGSLGGAEPEVNFYLTSTRPEAVAARQWVNAAYSRFPDTTGSLASRLRSTDNIQHLSALDELFVHEQLVPYGRVVPEEGGQGPDFRIYRDTEYVGAVEVATLFMKQELAAEMQRHATITDFLNARVALTDWFVHFEVIEQDRANWVGQQIQGLPGAGVAGRTAMPWMPYETDGVKLRFRFVPRVSDVPPKPTDHIVGMGPMIGGFVDSYLRLRSALEKKVQKRYDTRDKPMAIFVGERDTMSSLDQFEDALLGNEQVVIAIGQVERAKNGFFGLTKERPEGKRREISCLITTRGWVPWAPTAATLVRFDNPFAASEFPDDLLPAQYRLAKVEIDHGVAMAWLPPGHPDS